MCKFGVTGHVGVNATRILLLKPLFPWFWTTCTLQTISNERRTPNLHELVWWLTSKPYVGLLSNWIYQFSQPCKVKQYLTSLSLKLESLSRDPKPQQSHWQFSCLGTKTSFRTLFTTWNYHARLLSYCHHGFTTLSRSTPYKACITQYSRPHTPMDFLAYKNVPIRATMGCLLLRHNNSPISQTLGIPIRGSNSNWNW